MVEKNSEEGVPMKLAAPIEAAEDYGDTNHLSSDEVLVERVFQDVLDEISIEVACGMHRMTKMGDLSYVSIMFPPVQHPVLREPTDIESNHDTGNIDNNNYNNDTEDGDNSHVDLLASGSVPKKARLTATTVQEMEEPGTNTTTTTPTTRSAVTDIWGRIPPKEPRRTATCTLCGRHLSALRFAQHLEKCMGIGGSTRGSSSFK